MRKRDFVFQGVVFVLTVMAFIPLIPYFMWQNWRETHGKKTEGILPGSIGDRP